MEPSPLTQQARPEVFQQKIVELYETLFKVLASVKCSIATKHANIYEYFQDEDEEEKSEGFWREFFLLKPSKAELRKILIELSPDDLLHIQV